MSVQHAFVIGRRGLQASRLLQIALISLFWLIGETVSRVLGLPVPGAVIGMLLVLALLAAGWINPLSMQRGARWFLAEMLLFFIPAVLAVLDHQEYIGLLGLKILAVIVVGTITVMSVTALTVEFGLRLMSRRVAIHDAVV